MTRFFILCLFLFTTDALATLRLPALVGNHMVLQRDQRLPLWGWADKGTRITVTIQNQTVSTKTGSDGKWTLMLEPLPAGGPFTLTVTDRKTRIELTDVLVGDVWLCGGQSNMVWKLDWGVEKGPETIAQAHFPLIRQFQVRDSVSYLPRRELRSDRGWELCSPQTAGTFSAVAFFFARDLFRQYGVPIGLISSSWGGTPAEAWMNVETLKTLPEYRSRVETLVQSTPAGRNIQYEKNLNSWVARTNQNDKGLGVPAWHDPAFPATGWATMPLPGFWEDTELPNYNGLVWFRKEIILPPEAAGRELTLRLGHPDDMDSTWFNGLKVGGSSVGGLRQYRVPGTLVKAGKNVIVIRILDFGGDGGIGAKPEEFQIEVAGQVFPLAGTWQYQTTGTVPYTAGWPPQKPDKNAGELGVLYNAMLLPLAPYGLKGVIWYQGESNTSQAYTYRQVFATLIQDWRRLWQPEMPFLFVQLANFMPAAAQPVSSAWAELREAQSMALKLPKTAMAVTIDIGNARDIHPRNKEDVGHRLALAARSVAYGDSVAYAGPVYESMRVEGNTIRLLFRQTGTGLVSRDKYGYLKGFAVAGADQQFRWARATIDGETIVVQSAEVISPVAVRYGWADNPDDVNLYDRTGLPASPFRTDNWPVSTQPR